MLPAQFLHPNVACSVEIKSLDKLHIDCDHDFLLHITCLKNRGTHEVCARVQDRVDAPSVWKLDDPETLRKERDEKRAAADAAARLKLERKRDTKVSSC